MRMPLPPLMSHTPGKYWLKLVALFTLPLALLLPLGGCLGPDASYKFGLSTSEVVGKLPLSDEVLANGQAIVVVVKYHHTFITLDSGQRITRPSAHLAQVYQNGEFRVSMPSNVVAMDLYFIEPDHLTDTYHFKRQVGVGEVTYRPKMPPMPDWRSHFYTFLQPQLQHFIAEPRYAMNTGDQQKLTEWLMAREKALEGQ